METSPGLGPSPVGTSRLLYQHRDIGMSLSWSQECPRLEKSSFGKAAVFCPSTKAQCCLSLLYHSHTSADLSLYPAPNRRCLPGGSGGPRAFQAAPQRAELGRARSCRLTIQEGPGEEKEAGVSHPSSPSSPPQQLRPPHAALCPGQEPCTLRKTWRCSPGPGTRGHCVGSCMTLSRKCEATSVLQGWSMGFLL